MRLAVYLLFMLAGVGVILAFSYRRWQQLTERERFLLGMKEASIANNMLPDERLRLKLLRSLWWVVWRCLTFGTALLRCSQAYFSGGDGPWIVTPLPGGVWGPGRP